MNAGPLVESGPRERDALGKERDITMKIIRGTELIPVEHPVFLIFGQPGICKTSLAYSAKNPLLLDFDKGAHRSVNRRDTAVIDSWSDVTDLNAETLANYDTVIVDTVGRALDIITADIAATDPKKAPGGNLTQQGWGVLKNRFRQWMSSLRSMGKDVILIAHDKEDKDGETRIVRPEIVGGSYGEVMKIADFVGYISMNGRDRVLDFNPTDRWIGKNPGAWAPFKVPPVAKATTFMAERLDQGREALGHISEESAAITKMVEVWREKLAGITTAAALNAEMPLVKAIEQLMVKAQASKLLMDRGAELKLDFDAKAKQFTEAKQAEAVPA